MKINGSVRRLSHTHLNIIRRAFIYRRMSTLGNYVLRFILINFQLFVIIVKKKKIEMSVPTRNVISIIMMLLQTKYYQTQYFVVVLVQNTYEISIYY